MYMKAQTVSKKNRKRRTITAKKLPSLLSIRLLPIGYKLYGSKVYDGNAILQHSHMLADRYRKKCIPENLTWLGSYSVAKKYETQNTKLYEWRIKSPTKLAIINTQNEIYYKKLFLNTTKRISPLIHLSNAVIKNINYTHPYFSMSNNERAWREFAFAYGFLSLREQYEFLLLLRFLLNNKIVSINMRNGNSIVSKVQRDIYYFNTISHLPYKLKEKYNRISFYAFDQSALTNLCKLLPNDISGVYQPNTNSFWFPNLVIYKMDIEEYVLFNPHYNLEYNTQL